MPQWKARLKKAAKILLFLLIIDGFLLGLAEAVARIGWPPYYTEIARKEQLGQAKAAGQKRVFIYGESTIYGFPYGPENSTARWVQLLLQEELPGQSVQVVNFGRPARGSFHLDEAVRGTLGYQPDVVVLCLGHNEFLPRSLALTHGPNHRWWYFHLYLYRAGVDGLNNYRSRKQTDQPANFTGIKPWSPEYAQSVTAYLVNVQKMVERCQKANIPVVVCAPGCNLNSPPRLSAHRQDLSPAAFQRHAQLLQEIRTKVRRGESAAQELAAALPLSPEYAETHYWQGRELLAQGKQVEALTAFQQARDLDCLCFRCTGPMLDGLHRITTAKQVSLVDFPTAFVHEDEGAPPGMAWFMDACHPRPWGQHLLAREIVATLRQQRMLGTTVSWRAETDPTFSELVPKIGLTPEQWRTAERTGAFHLLEVSPELVADMTQLPPALSADDDLEWAALHLLALHRCGRTAAVAQLRQRLLQGDPAPLAALVSKWPPQVQQWWQAAVQ
jgi:lysophospholipase L1-like esterase